MKRLCEFVSGSEKYVNIHTTLQDKMFECKKKGRKTIAEGSIYTHTPIRMPHITFYGPLEPSSSSFWLWYVVGGFAIANFIAWSLVKVQSTKVHRKRYTMHVVVVLRVPLQKIFSLSDSIYIYICIYKFHQWNVFTTKHSKQPFRTHVFLSWNLSTVIRFFHKIE